MNNLVITRGKEIIISLLIIILILVFLLFKPTTSKSLIDPRISTNLDNFINLLLDPQQNVHAVILAAPDKGGNLVILNKFLKPIEPCFKSPEKISPGTQIIIEPECKEENVTRGEDQIIGFSPGIKDGSTSIQKDTISGQASNYTNVRGGKTSILWITEFDKKQTKACINPDGTIGPPCY